MRFLSAYEMSLLFSLMGPLVSILALVLCFGLIVAYVHHRYSRAAD